MKMWLIAMAVVLAFIAVDITVRIGWDRFLSGIGTLVDEYWPAAQVRPDTTTQPRTTPPRLEPPPPAPEAASPDGIVRQYYTDLSRHDFEAARGKWKTPPPQLQNTVRQVDWYRVEDAKLHQVDSSAAQVEVVVIGKRLNQQPERWSGTIALEKISGAWKIATMHLTKQLADGKNTSTDRGQTPKQPTQPLPGALPWSGEQAEQQAPRAGTPVGRDGTPAPSVPLSRRGPASGSATRIANLPSGWQGECLESPPPKAYCAVWRDGPGPSRLLYVIQGHRQGKGIGYIQLILPDTPDFVLIGLAVGNGNVLYKESRTVWIGNGTREVYPFLSDQDTLLLRLVRGGTTEDLALPVRGFNQAEERLINVVWSQQTQDQQRILDAIRQR